MPPRRPYVRYTPSGGCGGGPFGEDRATAWLLVRQAQAIDGPVGSMTSPPALRIRACNALCRRARFWSGWRSRRGNFPSRNDEGCFPRQAGGASAGARKRRRCRRRARPCSSPAPAAHHRRARARDGANIAIAAKTARPTQAARDCHRRRRDRGRAVALPWPVTWAGDQVAAAEACVRFGG